MKLKNLLKDISDVSVKGSKEVEVTGLCSHSKRAAPGDLFIAKKGLQDECSAHIAEAIAAGAVAVLTDFYNPFAGKTVQIIHPDPSAIEGALAARFYQTPSNELFAVGITGTNGKTTCSFLVHHLLEALKKPCGVIGTVEYLIGHHRYPATHTTPDVVTNQKLLKEMVASSCTAVAMEVSSHGLDQGRVDQIDFDAAIFTNLTQDHLDYHKTMERYAEAKAKLFTSLNAKSKKKRFAYPRTAIINNDSPYSEKMVADCTARVISYGIQQQADVRAEEIVLGKDYSAFNVVYEGKSVPFRWNLIGRFNISNCLAVTALGLTLGASLEEIAAIAATFQSTRGRLEQVPNEAGLHIYVDYAHTDDALINVLTSLNEVKEGRIITVFGCGGNRDRGKRPKMAQAVGKLSDVSIVTSDNPRDEDPLEICQEVIQGFAPGVVYQVEVDRRKAIELAVQSANHEDIILIAGKGHETYQIFKHKTIQFDDKAVAAELCAQRAALQKGK